MKQKMEKKEDNTILNLLTKFFWIFMIGSFLGYIAETAVVLIEEGHYENRQGLIYGPFVQIYGIGAIIYYLFVPKINNKKFIFPICMIVGGILEYMLSYIQQILFGTISWDYSNYMFHLNGRTSLLHCIYWGLAGIFALKIMCPFIDKMNEKQINNKYFKVITLIVFTFMMCNITISWTAANRQEERMKQIPANGKLDTLLDKYYPDSIMDKVYVNKINKIKK